jgi:hypothetical protein
MAIPWKSGDFLIADPCNLPFLVTIERQFIYRSWRPGTRVCCCRRGVAPRPWRQAPACPRFLPSRAAAAPGQGQPAGLSRAARCGAPSGPEGRPRNLRGGAGQAGQPRRRPRLAAARQTAAIMDSVPGTPGPQTRTAVTQRIIAHVTRGWPHLGEPIVRHRGRYCYISAGCPPARLTRTRADPAPALPGISRPLGHRDLPGQQRPVHRDRAAHLLRAQDRHPRRRGR